MPTSMQVPAGHKLVTLTSYTIVPGSHVYQCVRVTGRRWWQFWLPRWVYVCTVLVPTEGKSDYEQTPLLPP